MKREMLYDVMRRYAQRQSFEQIAKATGVSPRTVSNWVKRYGDDPVCKRIKDDVGEQFVRTATEGIDTGTLLIVENLKDYLKEYQETGEPMSAGELAKVATIVGTLYDKRALALGEATENTAVSIKVPEEVAVYGV